MILELGESPYKQFFLEYVESYTAVDWSDGYPLAKVDIVADLCEKLPIRDGVADTIVSLSVLEHLREPQKFLSECHRILKPGAAIILQVPWQWWVHEAPNDFFRYTPYGLRYLFEGVGFTEIYIEPQSGFFTTIILKVNYFSLRLIRGPRVIRWILRGTFRVLWYVGQKVAPLLDRLDKDWELEAGGYFVRATKP